MPASVRQRSRSVRAVCEKVSRCNPAACRCTECVNSPYSEHIFLVSILRPPLAAAHRQKLYHVQARDIIEQMLIILPCPFLILRRNHCNGYNERRIQVHKVTCLANSAAVISHIGGLLMDSCVIVKNVDHADLLLNRCNHTVDESLPPRGDVAHISVRFNALTPYMPQRPCPQGRALMSLNTMAAPAPAIALAIRETNAVGCACHKCDFSFQWKQFCVCHDSFPPNRRY